MYDILFSPTFLRTVKKLKKKNKQQYDMIVHKTQEICINPHRYKNLKYPLNNLKRVHVDEHFVLLFSVDEANKTVTLESFKHHDSTY